MPVYMRVRAHNVYYDMETKHCTVQTTKQKNNRPKIKFKNKIKIMCEMRNKVRADNQYYDTPQYFTCNIVMNAF